MTTKTFNEVCRATIARTLTIFHGAGSTIEVRALGVGGKKNRTGSGYFNDIQVATNAVAELARKNPKGIYFCLNPISPDLLSRAQNRIQEFPESTTSDSDILGRRWLYLDFDPVRASGISSTDDEHAAALLRAQEVSDWLKEQGFPEPILADSGNGVHLHFPIDLTTDEDSTALLKAVVTELARRFDDRRVTIDTSVTNLSRICRIYGTSARKGDNTEERPHRRSNLIQVPDYLRAGWRQSDSAGVGLLQKMLSLSPATVSIPKKSAAPQSHRHLTEATPIDLRELLTMHGIPYHEGQASTDYPVKLHVQCPFNDSHIHKDAYVAQHSSGALVFHCSHNSCAQNDWKAFKGVAGILAHRSKRDSAPVGVGSPKAGKKRIFVDKGDDFQPFPIDQLPEPLAGFCTEVAASVGCDPSFAALASLSVCSAAIGTTRQVCLKKGWSAPCVLWTVLVGESGTQKSPPFRFAMAPLKERQENYACMFDELDMKYHSDLEEYRRDVKRSARNRDCEGPKPPDRPIRNRCIVQDVTIEALAPILKDNPRGVLLARDELSSWLAGFDRYSRATTASSEVPKWLEIYNCESITIDRKTGDEKFLNVRNPFVSLSGGIQPGILSRILTDEHKQNGLQSRLLMTFPPRQPKKWRNQEVSSATLSAYQMLIEALFQLKPDDSRGKVRPATLHLDSDARELFSDYVNRTGDEQSAMTGHPASQWSKLEEIPARLSIVLHGVRQVTYGVKDPWQIDEVTMLASIALAEWFKDETLRINRLLTESEELRQMRQLASWIQKRGGKITARDLCKYRRDITSSDHAESILIDLVDARFGTWQNLSRSREFVLYDSLLSADSV